jgi:hypothetical protein
MTILSLASQNSGMPISFFVDGNEKRSQPSISIHDSDRVSNGKCAYRWPSGCVYVAFHPGPCSCLSTWHWSWDIPAWTFTAIPTWLLSMVQSTVDKSSIHTLSRVPTHLHPQPGSVTQHPVLIPSPQYSPLDSLTPALEKNWIINKELKRTCSRGVMVL